MIGQWTPNGSKEESTMCVMYMHYRIIMEMGLFSFYGIFIQGLEIQQSDSDAI